ncbi:MAG: HK97 gp10 family phage protein [Anaerotignum sp.]|nr:HK97 gp10 family phage protein [Anaerotignum sp.]
MARRVKLNGLADVIKDTLKDYADVSSEKVKTAVKEAGKTVKKEIEMSAPKDTGDYSKSWAVKNVRETASSLEVAVHSKSHYQLAHLLEFGHAKRGGGRVSGKVHIASAEAKGIEQFETDIEKALKG